MQLMNPTQQYGAPTQVLGLMGGGIPRRYARGGAIKPKYGLPAAAQQLRRKGRHGDTMLVHMQPKEVAGLAALARRQGGSVTINPHTGLPEFFSLGGFFEDVGDAIGGAVDFVGDAIGDVGSWFDDTVIQPVIGAANDIAEALGPVGLAAATYFGGPIGAAVYSGFQAPGDDFDLGNAVRAGTTAYVGGELMGSGGASPDYGAAGSATTSAADYAAAVDSIDAAAGLPSLGGVEEAVSSAAEAAASAGAGGGPGIGAGIGPESLPSAPVSFEPVGQTPTVDVTGYPGAAAPIFEASDITQIASQTPSTMSSILNLGGGIAETAQAAGRYGLDALKGITMKDLKDAFQLASAGMTAYGGYSALKERQKQQADYQKVMDEQEKKKEEQKAFAEQVLRDYPLEYRRLTAEDVRRLGLASGGEVPMPMADIFDRDDGMAKGGIASVMPPRFLSGGGDGMSDSIPANIEGKQEARLADGEFVIPADVVSHIGNGSSKAGAKRLYEMMDRVRHARTGKQRQAPQINAKRLMPA